MPIEITGDPDDLRIIIPQMLLINKQLEDKNLGVIVADLAIDALRFKNTPEIMMSIFWSTSENPPHWKPLKAYNNKMLKPVLTMSGLDRKKLDWQTIKTLAAKRINYGRHRCIARLDNGSKLTLHGGSVDNTQDALRGLIFGLTSCKSLTFTAGTESDDPELSIKSKGTNLYKPRVKIYPHSVALLNKRKMLRDERSGRQLIDGKFIFESSPKMPLWFQEKPLGWDDWLEKYTRRVDQD